MHLVLFLSRLKNQAMTDLSSNIASDAAKAKRTKAGDLEIERRSLKEQIDADRYLASKTATAGAKRGIAFVKLKPPGAV